MTTIVPVILNGGSGTRLWPMSREDRPKQFLPLVGDDTLLQNTVKRAIRVSKSPSNHVVTVTLASMKKETLRQYMEVDADLSDHILTEPQAQNTAAAFIFAALYTNKVFGADAIMWILPSDHHIGDELALKRALTEGIKAAENNKLITLGIKPTRPETGYGYIKTSDNTEDYVTNKVAQFVEKPPLDVAQDYFESGKYLWASGMHVFKASAFIDYFEKFAPDTLEKVLASMDNNPANKMPKPIPYNTIQKLPYESAVLEKVSDSYVVPCDIDWSDVGSWQSLWEISEKDKDGNAKDSGRVIFKDSSNTYVRSYSDRLITCIGVENLVITDTGNAIMVADKNNNAGIKTVVATLKSMDSKEIFETPKQFYPWGHAEVLTENKDSKTRIVTIHAGQERCKKMHVHRNECWIVMAGEGEFMLDGKAQIITAQESVTIPAKAVHTIKNTGPMDLVIMECQYGRVLDSSDIVRFDDPYGKKIIEAA